MPAAPAPMQEQPVAEEVSTTPTTGTAAPAEQTPEVSPVVREAHQQPAQAPVGFWARIKDFFGDLFG